MGAIGSPQPPKDTGQATRSASLAEKKLVDMIQSQGKGLETGNRPRTRRSRVDSTTQPRPQLCQPGGRSLPSDRLPATPPRPPLVSVTMVSAGLHPLLC